MGQLLYNLSLLLYASAVRIAAVFLPKARLFVQGRKHVLADLHEKFRDNTAPVAWFHCASLGEFEQGRPLLEAFKAKYPSYKILLTFFSPSGYEVRKHYNQADLVCYLPLDSRPHAEALLTAVRPSVAFFVKYEFWYYYLQALQTRKIPVFSVSAIFRPQQLFFKWYGGFQRSILGKFAHLFVQDAASAQLLATIGLQQVTVAGDTRFDRVFAIAGQQKTIDAVAAFRQQSRGFRMLVVGSSWPQDIALLAQALQQFPYGIKLCIAPHEISEPYLQQIEKAFAHLNVQRFTEAADNWVSVDVLLVNTVGLLSSLYAYGDMAYVGGAFGKGLHNVLEPAAQGVPVIFGNKFDKFQEAKGLVAAGGGFPVADAAALRERLTAFCDNEAARLEAGAAAAGFVRTNIGATQQILDFCTHYLN